MASLELDYQELLAGTSNEVRVLADLEVPVAGAQLEIEYDPDQVSFQVPQLSQRSEHFLIEYKDTLAIVSFDLHSQSGTSIVTACFYNYQLHGF